MKHAPVGQIAMIGLCLMALWPFLVREVRGRWK